MDPRPRYFVRLAEGVRGPMAAEHLRDLASAGFVTRASEIAPSAAGPWTPLAGHAICGEVFPERRAIAFKAAEFEPVRDLTAPALDPDRAREEAHRPPASFRGREIVVAPLGLRGTLSDEPPNEVQQIVQEVGRRIAAHAPPPPPPPPRPPPFPRWRWFLAAGVLGSAAILSLPLFYASRYDPMSVAILLFWVALYDGFLVFVMLADRQHNEGLRLRSLKPDRTDPSD